MEFKVSPYRGLISPWKQIVYYNFDTTMNQSLLMSIIRLCESSHAYVRGIICDMGNSKLLKELEIYSECKHFFLNPCDANRKIYVFPDIPHCIKNLRNHCLDYDLCVKGPDDKTLFLRKQHFESLILADRKDFKLCPKLSLLHVNCKGNDRQRVKFAVQLFSDTVAKALKFKFGDDFLAQSEIVSTIDSWFDVMNSHCKFHWKNNKCALGSVAESKPGL
jgi:Transposase protein